MNNRRARHRKIMAVVQELKKSYPGFLVKPATKRKSLRLCRRSPLYNGGRKGGLLVWMSQVSIPEDFQFAQPAHRPVDVEG